MPLKSQGMNAAKDILKLKYSMMGIFIIRIS